MAQRKERTTLRLSLVRLRIRGAWSEVVFRQAFPMEADARRLAASELVLVNWPEGVMFPGEERASHTMPKGISDLTRGNALSFWQP
ncbi:hypothetical protein EV401DRAFT_180312 [Pisolithus croceorrhizus]|nr:hypothetical protein EV401DRAFT_180312 [Pisolithus croceorrhizus]